jgi:hypothetical protein
VTQGQVYSLIKCQALVRGYLTRKRLEIYGPESFQSLYCIEDKRKKKFKHSIDQSEMYYNQRVELIRAKMGHFIYGQSPQVLDGVKLEM